jgi:hypothetical protein
MALALLASLASRASLILALMLWAWIAQLLVAVARALGWLVFDVPGYAVAWAARPLGLASVGRWPYWRRAVLVLAVWTASAYVLVWIMGALVASGQTMCPDGSFVGGPSCVMAPNGKFVSGSSQGPQIAPDGSFVSGSRKGPQIAPDGSFTSGRGRVTLCADGSFVSGNCRMTPNGKFVGDAE